MFKISEFKKTLEEMREVHPFDDDACMMFERDLPSGRVDYLTVCLYEKEVEIRLSKRIKHEGEEW